jgi:hypothetical protein
MTKKKDNLRWVALGERERIIGYIMASYMKGRRLGRIHEIITAPEHDFTTVARRLVEKVHNILLEKGAAMIQVASIRNSYYPQIFPKLGFFNVETDGVFMYTIIDSAKFLDEISPIIANRLKQFKDWNGLLQITLEENNKYFKKDDENLQLLYSTNYNPDCKISLTSNALVSLLLGIVDMQRAWKDGLAKVETTLSHDKVSKLLTVLFPKQQFLAFDYW